MSTFPKPTAYQPRSVQVAEYLKELLRSGRWQERLPSERSLATEVGVSRDTIRAALALLGKEGVIRECRSSSSRVTRLSQPLSPGGIRVGFLLLMPVESTTYRTLAWMDEMRRLFYRHRIEVEVYDSYARKKGFFSRINTVSSCQFWVLIYPNHRALQWCTENNIRAVVAGTVDEKLGLPSVDIHYRALCRHAVGRMAHFGHTQIVLILHRRQWGADARSIDGFLEGVKLYGQGAISATIEYHNGTPESICALADRLLARQPRPTAWIIAVAPHFLTVMMHLQRRGIRIPEDVSLISQDAEPWQHFASPEPTRYVVNTSALAKSVVRFILAGVTGKPLPAKAQRLLPELINGQTLGRAPECEGATSAPGS